MNKRVLVAILALVVVLVGAVSIYALTRPAASDSAESTVQSSLGAGTYVEYSPTAIAEAEGTTLLFFYASWCPQCRSIDSDIRAFGIPDDVTVILVDYDKYQDLREQYGVTLQTTFVEVNSDGEAQQSFVAYDDPRFSVVVDAML